MLIKGEWVRQKLLHKAPTNMDILVTSTEEKPMATYFSQILKPKQNNSRLTELGGGIVKETTFQSRYRGFQLDFVSYSNPDGIDLVKFDAQ